MVMNTEIKEKNGKKSVNSPFNNKSTSLPAEDSQLTPETSDDDSSKHFYCASCKK
jgi:hypothetical protein